MSYACQICASSQACPELATRRELAANCPEAAVGRGTGMTLLAAVEYLLSPHDSESPGRNTPPPVEWLETVKTVLWFWLATGAGLLLGQL